MREVNSCFLSLVGYDEYMNILNAMTQTCSFHSASCSGVSVCLSNQSRLSKQYWCFTEFFWGYFSFMLGRT